MSNKEVKVTKAVKLDKKAAKPVVKVKKDRTQAKEAFVRGILGLCLLSFFGSVAFLIVVVLGGTEGRLYQFAAAPAILGELVLAFIAFSKILK